MPLQKLCLGTPVCGDDADADDDEMMIWTVIDPREQCVCVCVSSCCVSWQAIRTSVTPVPSWSTRVPFSLPLLSTLATPHDWEVSSLPSLHAHACVRVCMCVCVYVCVVCVCVCVSIAHVWCVWHVWCVQGPPSPTWFPCTAGKPSITPPGGHHHIASRYHISRMPFSILCYG